MMETVVQHISIGEGKGFMKGKRFKLQRWLMAQQTFETKMNGAEWIWKSMEGGQLNKRQTVYAIQKG